MSDVWDFGPADPTECNVLVCLSSHANDDGQSCFPSIARVAKMTRLSERTVQRTIQSLEAGEWISVTRGAGRGKVSSYAVNVAKLKRCQRDTLLEKGDIDAEKVTLTPIKGDIDAKPLEPLIGVNVSETSKEPSGAPSLALFPELEKQTPPTPSQFADLIRKDLFPYYLERTGRSAKMYSLTSGRLKLGVDRLTECLVKADGDLVGAQRMFWRAIEALTEDEFFMGKNDRKKKFNHWDKHLCKTTECFEGWLEEGLAETA